MTDKNQEIPGMDLSNKYKEKPTTPQESPEEKKRSEKTKKEFEKLKNYVTKKHSFTMSLSVLPSQSIKRFIEEDNVPKETENMTHIFMIVPEEKFKQIPKIREDIVKNYLEKSEEKLWLHIKTPVDLWENCFDSKFDIFSAIAMSYPIYDKSGFLESIRLAEIHKSLVLQKFEKYVVSYVLGGSLVRGDVVKGSDIDVFVIINDTDVKRMPRLELKERLRGIIYQYIGEAGALAGVKKNLLNVQVYLLTDFWEQVKDAHPVMFTFIRDGVPIYDRGTFMPWKALLKMGKLKPSPEAIDTFMSLGDSTMKRAKKALMDIALHEVYWGVTTPSQALLMLAGSPPPSPKNLVKDMKNFFVEKDKLLEPKYIKTVEKIVKFYKDYEHEKVKEISGKEVDSMLKDSEDYLKRLKELRKQIDKRNQEKIIEQIHKDIFEILKSIFGRKSQEKLVERFEKELVKEGKFTDQHLKILKNVVSVKKDFKKGKLDSYKVDEARKNASILINELIEYSQRKDLAFVDKGRMRLKFKEKGKEKTKELLAADGKAFLVDGEEVKKITDKVEDSTKEELSESLEKQKTQETINIRPEVFDILKKEIGDYELVI